jgi:sec-independent protein translocase protein TatC
MTFFEHLSELRARLIRSLAAILVFTLVSFLFLYDPAKLVLQAPLDALDPKTDNVVARYNLLVQRLRPHIAAGDLPNRIRLHQGTLMEAFAVKVKLAVLCGCILAAPYVLFQAWGFIGVGLTRSERRIVLGYLPLSLLLFATGMAFAYFLALPVAALFLLTVDPDIVPTIFVGPYFIMVAWTLVAFGAAFQLPLLAMALARLGIVSAATLAHSRGYAIVLMFVAAALLTPPEPFSQCLLALPLILLYELGIRLARRAERRSGA